jgi:hypothetical protein
MAQYDADSICATIDAWFREKIANGAIARNTDAYNQAYAARDDLKSRFVSDPAEPKTIVDKALAESDAQPTSQE